jgi:phosphate transport system ATP-binding protein
VSAEVSSPPPIRRLPLEDTPAASQVAPPASTSTNGDGAVVSSGFTAAKRSIAAPQFSIRRMEIDNVSVSYTTREAVKSVSMPVRQGEVLSLIGPSGCGKTTLLRSLNRLTELTRTATLPNPFPMSVFDNIAYVLREQGSRRQRKKALEPKVHSALERAGLFEEVKDNLDHPALRLSGGQQQRLCIARALAAEPEVLLLDEPCSALDPQSTQVIEDLIVKLRDDVAVVIVTHNLQQAYRIADHVAFMYLGELVEYSSATALFNSPREQRTKEYVSGAFG